MRVTTTRWRAALARLSPPRLSRWRVVLPLEAGAGQAPHSFANAASERIRSGLSPTRSSIAAAVPAPIPCAWTSSGARAAVSVSRWASWPLISSSSASQRRAIARRLAFADAAVEVIGPGRRAARCRIRAILPVMRSSRSRRAAGAPTMIAFSVTMAWVRPLTAVSRATLRWRIISTVPVPDFGRAVACPPSTARAALSASSGSLLPFRRRSCRSGRLTSRTAMPLRDQEARQAGAVGAGPLDAEGADRAQGPRPGLECLVAPLADRDGRRAETGTERVDRDGGVHVLVGVDADDDVGARGLVHGGGPPSQLRGPGDPAVGQDCDGTIALKLLSGHVPLDRQVPPGGADTSTRWHGASQGKGQAPRAAPILSQSRQLPLRLIDCLMPCRSRTWR